MTSQLSRPASILLAEDDELIRKVGIETLLSAGYRVETAVDGQDAWEKILRSPPDLILSDVRMPNCDGFELLGRVRRDPRLESTPFVIVSARAESADQRMGMSLGADDYVTKPYSPMDLLKTIQVRLERAAKVRDSFARQHQFLTSVLPHELRTPLTGVIGYADLIESLGKNGDGISAADAVEYGTQLRLSGERLLRATTDLALWAWLESVELGQGTGNSTVLGLCHLSPSRLRRWCESVADRYSRTHDLQFSLGEFIVRTPHEGMQQVMSHLVENACKFSLPGTPVRIEVRSDEPWCEISISDQGRGMPAAEIADLGAFRHFGRDFKTQRAMGLGLTLAGSFARISGGSFALVSNGDGRGLTARLQLPLASLEE